MIGVDFGGAWARAPNNRETLMPPASQYFGLLTQYF